MIKFESYLAINNNNKNNTASYNKKLDHLYAYTIHSYGYTLLIWKKVTKMVSCCIVFNLITKPIPTFWVNDWSN